MDNEETQTSYKTAIFISQMEAVQGLAFAI